MDRPTRVRRTWRVWFGVFSVLLYSAAGTDPPDEVRGKGARAFAERFLAGEFEEIQGDLSVQMQVAFAPDTAKEIRDGMLRQNGEVKKLGQAWREDVVESYSRFRVPVDFEKARLDLRIVYDSDGKVAGFFQVPHLPGPSAEKDGAVQDRPTTEIAGHWEGAIEVPGSALNVLVDLTYGDGAWSGSCDIPAQGAQDLPLGSFRVEGDSVSFSILGIPGEPTFRGALYGGRISGTFTQAGAALPFSLTRGEVARPGRPQEPKPPFPYSSEEVTFDSGDAVLAGTLTVPPGPGPHPAAVLISGSGPQNRDEEVFGHKPFLVLADHLTRAGIAVLRVDDRGVGRSTGDRTTATTADYAEDTLAGVEFLAGRGEIDSERIGLVGHSEGGIIAPLVAAESDRVAFVVMIAGPGVPGDEILLRQTELIFRAQGGSDEAVGKIADAQRKLLRAIREGAEAERVLELCRAFALVQLTANGAAAPSDETVEELLEQLAELSGPWFRWFLGHDPRPVLRRVEVPVLALFGELDLQVPPDQSLEEIRKALNGNADATVESLAGLNHLLQKAEKGTPTEYYAIEETVNPAALEAISGWIVARFLAAGG